MMQPCGFGLFLTTIHRPLTTIFIEATLMEDFKQGADGILIVNVSYGS